MHRLVGIERAYPWGSRTAIPALRGEQPSSRPIAEIWYGAHPASSSTIDGEPLSSLISQSPQAWLGEEIAARFDARLPFLMKILAAAEPLSLQAHPSKSQAEEGWARENELGVAPGSAERNYKDDNHKPEILVALSEFEAMAGFRPLSRTIALLRALECPALERYIAMIDDATELDHEAEESRLRALFTTWITIPSRARIELIACVMDSIDTRDGVELEPWMRHTLRNVQSIHKRYPGDVGVLGALLLNHVRLAPGEAVYLRAGSLHAYLSGVGVEVMANSDNVLRGGLTTKHVDVPELVKVLDFHSLADPYVHPSEGSEGQLAVRCYPIPVDDFTLCSAEISADDGELRMPVTAPTIAVVTDGELEVAAPDGRELLQPSEAVWLDARDGSVTLRSNQGAQVFFASV